MRNKSFEIFKTVVASRRIITIFAHAQARRFGFVLANSLSMQFVELLIASLLQSPLSVVVLPSVL